MKKMWLIGGTSVATFILLGAYFGLSAYMASSLIKVERVPITDNPESLGIGYRDVSFASRVDNLILKGWYLEGEPDQPTIIIVHGREGNRASGVPGILELAGKLVQEGYNVLMFDLRGHGDSEGTYISASYYERYDLLGAVDYVKSLGVSRIGVIGFSMGAATSILAAAEEPGISAVVSDSSFADLTEIINREFKKQTFMPGWFMPGFLFTLKVMHGIDLNAIRPIDAIGKIAPRPIFFIHGQTDSYISLTHANRLYEASNNTSNQIWIVPDAGHVQSYKTAPLEYVERITTLFEQKL